MKIKNETEIQLMKILYKTSGGKSTKNITSKRAYPIGIEKQYYRKLKGFFQPLTDYVNKYIDENMEQLLRGDSKEIRLDTIPGDSFREMLFELENWLSVYMPDISELPEDSNNNVILVSLAKTAEEAKKFGDKEFQKTIEKGIHINPPVSSQWWNDMRNSWAEDNYTLIVSNAKNYVSKINALTEQAIVNGMSPSKLKEEIKKATEGLSDKHCKLLARDQMGKLNGQITEAQMQEIGLNLYVWSTSFDDRVRDSHALMEGLLCRYDDANLCSYDNGKTWVERPAGAVRLHPGQDIQCRCVALAFYPELEAEMENVPMQEIVAQDETFGNPALSTPDMVFGTTPEIYNFTEEELKEINDNFEILTDFITNKGIRKYVKNTFETPYLSNNSLKAVFVKTLPKMEKPYFVFTKGTENETAYYYNGMITLLNQRVFKDKTAPIHEIIHAFSELNRKNLKPLSRDKDFMKAFNNDYSKLLISHGGKEKLLNNDILNLYYKNSYEYLPIIDLIGGKQGKNLLPLIRKEDYWKNNHDRVYDEVFAEVGQAMFDKKRSILIKRYFPESYNNIRKQFSLFLQGRL